MYFIGFFVDCLMLNIFFLSLHVGLKKICNFAGVYYIPIILSKLVVNNIIQMSMYVNYVISFLFYFSYLHLHFFSTTRISSIKSKLDIMVYIPGTRQNMLTLELIHYLSYYL